jgi:hypothetical protein
MAALISDTHFHHEYNEVYDQLVIKCMATIYRRLFIKLSADKAFVQHFVKH